MKGKLTAIVLTAVIIRRFIFEQDGRNQSGRH